MKGRRQEWKDEDDEVPQQLGAAKGHEEMWAKVPKPMPVVMEHSQTQS
jgi:hypothetical protein